MQTKTSKPKRKRAKVDASTHFIMPLSPPWTGEQAKMALRLGAVAFAWLSENSPGDLPRFTPPPAAPTPASDAPKAWRPYTRDGRRRWHSQDRMWQLRRSRPMRWYQRWYVDTPCSWTIKRATLAKGTAYLRPPKRWTPSPFWMDDLNYVRPRWQLTRRRSERTITSPPAVASTRPTNRGRLSEGWRGLPREHAPKKWRQWWRWWPIRVRASRWYQASCDPVHSATFIRTIRRQTLAKGTAYMTPPKGWAPGQNWRATPWWHKSRRRSERTITSPPAVASACDGTVPQLEHAAQLSAPCPSLAGNAGAAWAAMGHASVAQVAAAVPEAHTAGDEAFCWRCGAVSQGSAYYCSVCDGDLVDLDGDPEADPGPPDHPGPGRW